MPLVPYSLRALAPVLEAMGRGKARKKLLTFSHPDIIATKEALDEIFPGVARIPRKDSDEIMGWHKTHLLGVEISSVPDTEVFFLSLGFDMAAIDIVEGRGGEIIFDLNEPLPVEHHGKYDLVIDIIANQCFNVAQVFKNALQAAKVGGYIMHVLPVNMVNQGFWNVCPVALYAFYSQNNCQIVHNGNVVGVYVTKHSMERLNNIVRERNVADDTMVVFIAQKTAETPEDPKWVTHPKFIQYPDCKKSPTSQTS